MLTSEMKTKKDNKMDETVHLKFLYNWFLQKVLK